MCALGCGAAQSQAPAESQLNPTKTVRSRSGADGFCVWNLLVVVGFDALGQQLHGALEGVLIDDIGHTDLVDAGVRRLVEALGRGEHERVAVVVKLLKHEQLELFRVVHGQLGHDVERALRLGIDDAGDLLESFDERVAAGLVFLAHGVEVLGADGVERSGRDLVDRGGAQTALAPLHGVVVELRIARDHAADACAAGAEALGHGVDDDDVVLITLELQQAHELLAAVDKLAVHLVADDEQIVLLGDVGHETELFLGEDGAGWVAGVREEDGAGVLVDARLDALTDGELVVLLRRCGDRADGRAGQRDKRAVVRVERLGDDDLITLVEDAAERDLQRLAAAGGDEHLLVGDRRVDLAVVVDDRVDHLGHAVGRGVGQDRLAEVLHGIKISLRRGDVGLADVQVVEFLAFFGSLVCIGRELAHGREAAFFDLTGKFHVAPPFFFVFWFLFCSQTHS